MGQVLPGSATTTEAVRRAIQHSEESPRALAKRHGVKTPSYVAVSTDSNIPMSLGKPAMTLGSGFKAERFHSLDEALTLDKPTDIDNIALALAAVLLLVGAR